MEKWVIGEKECFEGAMSKETKLAVEDCNGKMQVVLEDTTTTTSGTKICETRTRSILPRHDAARKRHNYA